MHIKSTILQNTAISIIREFNNKKIHYALARNYKQYPNFGHDIDFLSNEPLWRLKKILIEVAKKNNWDCLVHDNHFSGLISNTISVEAFHFYKYLLV